MIRLRPVGLRGLDPRAQVPNIAHGLRCDAKLCCDARRQGVAHLSIRLGFKDLDRLRICVHIQAEYVCNVPECIASNQFSCRHRALRSVPHALIHHTCSPLSVVAGLGVACAAMAGRFGVENCDPLSLFLRGYVPRNPPSLFQVAVCPNGFV